MPASCPAPDGELDRRGRPRARNRVAKHRAAAPANCAGSTRWPGSNPIAAISASSRSASGARTSSAQPDARRDDVRRHRARRRPSRPSPRRPRSPSAASRTRRISAGSGDERIVAAFHRRRPRVAGASFEDELAARIPDDSGHDAERGARRPQARVPARRAARGRRTAAGLLRPRARGSRCTRPPRRGTTTTEPAPTRSTASIAATTPSAPSNRPPCGTVSRCDPAQTGRVSGPDPRTVRRGCRAGRPRRRAPLRRATPPQAGAPRPRRGEPCGRFAPGPPPIAYSSSRRSRTRTRVSLAPSQRHAACHQPASGTTAATANAACHDVAETSAPRREPGDDPGAAERGLLQADRRPAAHAAGELGGDREREPVPGHREAARDRDRGHEEPDGPARSDRDEQRARYEIADTDAERPERASRRGPTSGRPRSGAQPRAPVTRRARRRAASRTHARRARNSDGEADHRELRVQVEPAPEREPPEPPVAQRRDATTAGSSSCCALARSTSAADERARRSTSAARKRNAASEPRLARAAAARARATRPPTGSRSASLRAPGRAPRRRTIMTARPLDGFTLPPAAPASGAGRGARRSSARTPRRRGTPHTRRVPRSARSAPRSGPPQGPMAAGPTSCPPTPTRGDADLAERQRIFVAQRRHQNRQADDERRDARGREGPGGQHRPPVRRTLYSPKGLIGRAPVETTTLFVSR